ncbi:Importin alpha subunit (Karyopherin alpha subunit) (Serine-rich RNA polymerase I suppressor protein) [Mortierella hygrophila]|uniref:Importin alpha subunit (Karyopherin alpha subunit) (Serine-rich RNA polymerase I suppressor protein) n=1 Tax=Mortierella hygrophila TaxID=979708 RepID=A0A9P6FAR8_9FUNG|nr:Importin alpha subunit (Karyopherin alpha subunit) (Serine-rich RNA polymerase I suppressor protein) [Mortierella hygrophila]
MLATRSSAASKPSRASAQLKQKGSNAQRNGGNDQDEEDDLIEQLNRKLSNVTLNPSTNIPDEMNITDISTMLPAFAQPLYNLLASGNYEQQLLAMVRIRKYLSLQDVLPRIDHVLALDCINFFITFLNMSDCPDLQYETAWVVTNIAAGTTAQTEKLVEAGILTPLIHNLRVSRCVHVQTQTIWALGNISGDGPPYRDLILRSGALEVILQLIEMCEDPTVAKEQKYMILKIAVWCVSNLCRGSGRLAPEWLQVTPAFPMLRRLMYIDETDILADTCWAMCRILNGTHKMNLENVVIDRELCARFVALLSEPHPTIQVPSLRSLINIASGPEHHTQLLIDAMAIPILGSPELLAHPNSTIRRDALLGISNITAGTADQVREVTVQDNGNVMRRVLEILRRGDLGGEEQGEDGPEFLTEGGDWRVLREAAWVVSNATSVLDLEITGHLVYRLELLPSIAQLIDPRKTRKTSYVLPPIGLMHTALLTKLLDVVFNVLRCNEHHPKEQFMKQWVVDCEGGLILLELLRLSSQTPSETELKYLDNSKMLPRPLQHLRFTQNDNGEMSSTSTRSGQVTMAPLGASVKKRVETILDNFFEFGPENEGFGPFFSERQQGSTSGRERRDGYGSDYHEDGEDEDLDDDEYPDSNGYYSHHIQGGRGGGSNDVDFDLDDMEERVSRMNLT